MTRIIILFAFVSISLLSTAQKHNTDLLKSYSANELAAFDTGTIEILEYGITNAVYITTIPSGKELNLPEINLTSNSLKYTDLGLKILNQNQYFKVHGVENMMVVKSLYVLKNELENKNN